MLAKACAFSSGIMKEMELCPNSLLWLSENGRKSHDPEIRGNHDDGCGMAYAENGGIKYIKKGKEDFWDKEYHDFVFNAISKLYIAHNRYASNGLNKGTSGAHPFIIEKNGISVAFCHNGGVDSYMNEARERNTSDSEILLEKLSESTEIFNASSLCDALSGIAQKCSFSSLTAFLLTPTELFAWRLYNENKNDKEVLSKYYTLYISMREEEILIASEPLDDKDWLLLPNNMLVSLSSVNDNVTIHMQSIALN